MSENLVIFISGIATVGLLIYILIARGKEIFEAGYKKGQSDALSGIQKYHLLEFKNGERSWYKKEVINKNDFIDEYKDFKVIL